MPTSLSVRNLDDALIGRLKARAASNGRSAEAEVREILKNALDSGENALDVDRKAEFEKILAELQRATAGQVHTPSEILQREGRDER